MIHRKAFSPRAPTIRSRSWENIAGQDSLYPVRTMSRFSGPPMSSNIT